MALTLTQLKALLDPEEPNYAQLEKQLTPGDVPNLLTLIKNADAMLASKAAYALTLIHDASAVQALGDAAVSPHDIVRVASAAGLRNMKGLAVSPVAERLLSDMDAGVRKSAIRAAQELQLQELTPRLEAIANQDPETGLRALARDALRR